MKSLFLSLFIFFNFFTQLSFAQKSKIDSLETILVHTPADTNRVLLLNELVGYYWSSNPEKVKQYAAQSLQLAQELTYTNGIALSHVSFGIYYWSQSDIGKAMDNYQKALSLYEQTGNRKGIAKCYGNMGMLYKNQGRYSVGLENYMKALKIFEELNEKQATANILNSIGVLYKEQLDYNQALSYYLRSVEILKSLDQKSYAGGLSNIGIVYLHKKEYSKAIDYLNQSLQFFESANDAKGKVVCYNGLGEVYSSLKDYTQAKSYFEKSYTTSQSFGFNSSALAALLGLGTINLQTGKPDAAIAQFKKSDSVATALHLQKEKLLSFQGLGAAYDKKQDYKNAFAYQSKYIGLKDSLFNEESRRKIAVVQASYESEKKQAEIELLKKDQKLDQLIRNTTAIGLLTTLIIASLIVSRQRLKIKSNHILTEQSKREYEMKEVLAKAELNSSLTNEQQLKKELEFRNKELTTHTLNIIQKNEIMEELRELIHEIVQSKGNTSSIKYSRLIKLIDYSFTLDKDWDEFRMYFEQVHKEFFTQLKERYPELTSGELRLSALIRLNLSMKESATLLGISVDSVKTARHRLRKKLQLTTDQSLEDFIMSFDKQKEPMVQRLQEA